MKYRSSPKSSNSIGTMIKMFGLAVIVMGCIVSFGIAQPGNSSSSSWYSQRDEEEFHYGIALGGTVISIAAGMGLLAVAEVLNLLQTSCDLEYTILLHLRGEEETEAGAGTDSSAAADAGPVPPVSARTESSGKGTFSAPPSSVTARSGTASGGFIQFCPHCGAKQSRPAAKCWHCGSTLSGR